MKGIKELQQKALEKLVDRGIELRTFKKGVSLPISGGERLSYNLPRHSETDWFVGYVKYYLEEGMNPKNIDDLARKAYASLRYKQALAGSSDGTPLTAFFALSGHVLTDDAKWVYKEALKEYDTKAKQGILDSSL